MTGAIIVGQAPGRNYGADRPLEGPSGRRLERLAGLPEGGLDARFALANLLPRWPGGCGKGDLFPRREAREAAQEARAHLREFARVVLLGRNVAAAFGLADLPYLQWAALDDGRRRGWPRVAVVPHPSGVNHFWNDPANVARAERFLRALARRR